MAPANEHLTMQLATQAFKIPVVPNALIYFENASGEPANISRRIYTEERDPVKEKFDEEYKGANQLRRSSTADAEIYSCI